MRRDNPKNIKKALKQLIDDLDNVFELHEEVCDTAVREQMYDAVRQGFIMALSGYKLPVKFGMFSNAGNKLVRSALKRFLAHPDVAAALGSLNTIEARFAAFQDAEVESNNGNKYDEYFGYAEKP